jgi:predicted KAP-like P-loop ATPase
LYNIIKFNYFNLYTFKLGFIPKWKEDEHWNQTIVNSDFNYTSLMRR